MSFHERLTTMKLEYMIVREYAGVTAKKQLWEPLTRKLHVSDVPFQLEWFRSLENKKRKNRRREVFVIAKEVE